MSNIDFTEQITKTDKLAAEKRMAEEELRQRLEQRAHKVIGGYTRAEMQAWPQKEADARDLLAGRGRRAAHSMVQTEAAELGEDAMTLAQRIVAKANAFREEAAQIAAIRQKVIAVIEAAETSDAVWAALHSVNID